MFTGSYIFYIKFFKIYDKNDAYDFFFTTKEAAQNKKRKMKPSSLSSNKEI